MPKITFVDPDGTETVVDADVGETLMNTAVSQGVPGIIGQCGGGAMCGTCHVFTHDVDPQLLPPMHPVEDELLHGTATPRNAHSRLGCQIPITTDMDGIRVSTPPEQL